MPLTLPYTPATTDQLSYQGKLYAITNVTGPTLSADGGTYSYNLTTSAGVIRCSNATTTLENYTQATNTPKVWVRGGIVG